MVFNTLRYAFSPRMSATGNDGENPMVANRSGLKEFLVSIASMTGDLSNITAPPFVLDTKSVVEIPSYWAENPSLFTSPATSEDPKERALLILKSFIMGMKSQTYMGHSEQTGVKKPLNAFLGELFIGQWDDEENGTTYLVSEQVSHHPPITACRTWNPKHGVVAEGYNRQKITFSMSSASVNIGASGFALKSIEKYDEHYLLPLPDFRVKGVLSGTPYPETEGDWYIPSTNGFFSKVSFSGGKGFLGGGTKHGFTAILYKEEDGEKHPIYTLEGAWNTTFTIKDESGHVVETVDMLEAAKSHRKIQISPLEEMDPWESRRAWHDTAEAIKKMDFGNTSAAKGFLEQGQREMRKEEQKNGTKWQQAFFKNGNTHPIVEKLMAKLPGENFDATKEKTCGIWSFDSEAWENRSKPYHPGLEPDNLKEGQQRVYRNGSRASFQASRNLLQGQSPRASIDSAIFAGGADSSNATRRGSDSDKSFKSVDEKVGAVEDGRPANPDGVLIDVGRQPEKKEIHGITKDTPEPQTNQLRHKEEDLGTGIEGLEVKEKAAVEDMLRNKYASDNVKG